MIIKGQQPGNATRITKAAPGTTTGPALGNKVLYTLSSFTLLASFVTSGCDGFSTDTRSEAEFHIQPRVLRESDPEYLKVQASAQEREDKLVEIQASYRGEEEPKGTVAVQGSEAIPYPIYPGANQYRVGGENGLNIVLFETPHNFESVDQFYKTYLESEGFQRLVGMDDYIRYEASGSAGASAENIPTASSSQSDQDTKNDQNRAWLNESPGIVIHSFNSISEAESSGANASARTNIIVSY